MFLRAHARWAGLTDRGRPMQATYVAALEGGRIAGVAAHCWNGMVLVQAPDGGHAAAATLEAVRRSGRTVTGFSGPWDQVGAARAALGVAAAPAAKDSRDGLRSEEHTSELQSRVHLGCRLLLETKSTASDV